jgi:hypothetical protein
MEAKTRGFLLADELPRGFGQEHLTAMGRRADTRRQVHIRADVTLSRPQGSAGVYANPDSDRPIGELVLDLTGGHYGVRRVREDREEGIALGIDLIASMPGQGCPNHGAVVGEELWVLPALLVEQTG